MESNFARWVAASMIVILTIVNVINYNVASDRRDVIRDIQKDRKELESELSGLRVQLQSAAVVNLILIEEIKRRPFHATTTYSNPDGSIFHRGRMSEHESPPRSRIEEEFHEEPDAKPRIKREAPGFEIELPKPIPMRTRTVQITPPI